MRDSAGENAILTVVFDKDMNSEDNIAALALLQIVEIRLKQAGVDITCKNGNAPHASSTFLPQMVTEKRKPNECWKSLVKCKRKSCRRSAGKSTVGSYRKFSCNILTGIVLFWRKNMTNPIKFCLTTAAATRHHHQEGKNRECCRCCFSCQEKTEK